VGPGTTPPLGIGSATIELNSALGGIILATQKYQAVRLADIKALRYSTYTNLPVAAMTFQINYDPDVTTVEEGTWYGRLTYEPYMSGTVTAGTWQTWDMIASGAKWWASSNGASPVDDVCGQGNPCTIETLLAAFPNIGVRNDTLSGIGFKAGSNWNGFAGNIDNFVITTGGNTAIYDFEPLTTAYVDDSWSAVALGTDPDGAGPAMKYGFDSFDSITEGIDAVISGGSVNVAAGSYNEPSFEINKSVLVLGPNAGIPGNGTRTDEAVVFYGTEWYGIDVLSEGVTIDGLKFDGTSLTPDGYSVGIAGDAGNLIIQNNVFVNHEYISIMTSGVYFDGVWKYDKYLSDVQLKNNYITSSTLSTSPYNFGIYAQSTLATISGNVVTNMRNGIQVQPYKAPGVGQVTGNTFEGYRTGVYFNYTEVASANWIFENNMIRGIAYPSGLTADRFNAIRVETFYAGNVIFEDNQILTGSTNATSIYQYFETNVTSGIRDISPNWWGSAAGPAPSYISGTVSYIPWCINEACTTFGAPVVNVNRSTYFTTIQAAISDSATQAGDTIQISAGTFNENVVINKNGLTLIGALALNPNDTPDPTIHTIINSASPALTTNPGITINSGITGVTIRNLRVQNFSSDIGIYGVAGNNNLTIENVHVYNNNTTAAVNGGGIYMNGPVSNVLINNVDAQGNRARGIVIWNGFKQNITITNSYVANNNCCGIELQDGTASGLTVTGNTVVSNADSGMAFIGLTSGAGPNVISGNTVTNNGRFGIEIKLPNGTGLATGDGSIVVENNTVTLSVPVSDLRDYAGIGVIRRGLVVSEGNADIPAGVIVRNNTVNGYRQTNPASFSTGFGIVVEGIKMTVSGNTLNNNDIGLQVQSGHLPYTANTSIDGDQTNLDDDYFGRGNSPVACANVTSTNTYAGNTVDYRVVGVGASGSAGVLNTNPGISYCTIQSAIAAASSGDTLSVAAGTYVEVGQIVINKNLTITGEDKATTIIKPAQNTGDRYSGDAMGWWLVQAGKTLNLSNVTLDGEGKLVWMGILSYGPGTINNNIFKNIGYNPSSNYGGIGISFWNANMTISNNLFQNIGRVGIHVNGSGTTAATISGNTYEGKGVGNWLDYGVEVERGAIASISNNTISNCLGVASVDGSTSAGIYATTFFNLGTTATITNNILDNNTTGISIGYYSTDESSVTATGNTFTDNESQISATNTSVINISDALVNNTFDRAVTVSHLGALLPEIWSKIQLGIDAAFAGDIVNVAAGTYIENVLVNKSVEIAGAGQTDVFVKPALLMPYCDLQTLGSLCGGSASNVFLVQANDVKIHDLTVDGDNPDLTSTYNVDGANLDARNGIIKNGTYNNLEVYNTTVKNIYLRGIYSTGGSFNFHHNTVTNVQAEYGSIAMFAWGGPGTMAYNTVSYANDGISANHSKGIQFLNNTVTNSGSGIHTDNSNDGGGVADLIQGNTVNCTGVPGAYGIWTFVPYLAPTVDNNTITNCDIGLSAWGQGAAVTTQFSNNTVTGNGSTGSVGAYITTDLIGWGYTDVSVNFTGNTISGFETGIYLTANQQSWNTYPYLPKTITSTFYRNNITDSTGWAVYQDTDGTYVNHLEENWWGGKLGPQVPITAGVDVIQWCGTANPTCLPLLPEAGNIINLSGTITDTGDFNIYVPGLTINLVNGTTLNDPDSPCFNVYANNTKIYAESKLSATCIPGTGQNGVNVAAGLTDVRIKNIVFTGPTAADGIHYAGAITGLNILDNWFHNLGGDAVQFTVAPTSPINIQGNLFQNNAGLGINASTFAVPAEFNSWGHVDGAVAGDGKSTNVDADPWTHVDLYLGASGVPGSYTYTVRGNLVNVMGASFTLQYPAGLTPSTPVNLSSFEAPLGADMFEVDTTARTITFNGAARCRSTRCSLPVPPPVSWISWMPPMISAWRRPR